MPLSNEEVGILEQVNDVGLKLPEYSDNNLVFIALSPYLDSLMKLLKKSGQTGIQSIFLEYLGVKAVMMMIESEAQVFEKEKTK